jgi:TPP-dependent pyruvate/acetoin dehydrogenase alpha subunit
MSKVSPSRDKLLDMYGRMRTIRAFETKVNELFTSGVIVGDLHLSIGQEAAAVGVCAALRETDMLGITHRGHGYCIAKGVDVKRMMAEFFAKRNGICKGKGGSIHLADFSVGMLGANGIVGGGIPHAVGAALAFKMRKTDQVAAVSFGDGASNQGTFHESINLAAIWSLPVVFVCENNQYAESTPTSAVMLVKNVADRAVAYGIPGVVVDGMDVLAVLEAMQQAVERARRGLGPTLLELKTYRFEGHEIGDPWDTYRGKDEVENWKKKDPITNLRQKLMNDGLATREEIEKLEKDAVELIDSAVDFAKQSPSPEPKEAFEDVFVSPYY